MLDSLLGIRDFGRVDKVKLKRRQGSKVLKDLRQKNTISMLAFKKEYYDEDQFTGLDCSGENLSDLEFRDCEFVDCDFSGCKMGKTHFSGCLFKGCNFSNVKLYDARISEVDFVECKLAGVDFTDCNQVLFSISLSRCKASYCVFEGMDLVGCRLTGSELAECVFERANLSKADFTGSDLQGALFDRANLQSANFQGAHNYVIDPRNTDLKKAKFSYPDVLGLLKPFGIKVV